MLCNITKIFFVKKKENQQKEQVRKFCKVNEMISQHETNIISTPDDDNL